MRLKIFIVVFFLILPAITSPQEIEKYLKLANENMELGEYKDALYFYQKALEISPQNKDALIGKKKAETKLTVISLLQEAKRYEEKGNVDSAIKSYKAVIKLEPGNRTASTQLEKLEKRKKIPIDTTEDIIFDYKELQKEAAFLSKWVKIKMDTTEEKLLNPEIKLDTQYNTLFTLKQKEEDYALFFRLETSKENKEEILKLDSIGLSISADNYETKHISVKVRHLLPEVVEVTPIVEKGRFGLVIRNIIFFVFVIGVPSATFVIYKKKIKDKIIDKESEKIKKEEAVTKEKLEKELDELKGKYTRAEQEISRLKTLEKAKSEEEKKSNELEKELQELKTRYSKLEEDTKQIEMFKQTIKEEQETRKELERELAEIRSKYEQLEKERVPEPKTLEKSKEEVPLELGTVIQDAEKVDKILEEQKTREKVGEIHFGFSSVIGSYGPVLYSLEKYFKEIREKFEKASTIFEFHKSDYNFFKDEYKKGSALLGSCIRELAKMAASSYEGKYITDKESLLSKKDIYEGNDEEKFREEFVKWMFSEYLILPLSCLFTSYEFITNALPVENEAVISKEEYKSLSTVFNENLNRVKDRLDKLSIESLQITIYKDTLDSKKELIEESIPVSGAPYLKGTLPNTIVRIDKWCFKVSGEFPEGKAKVKVYST